MEIGILIIVLIALIILIIQNFRKNAVSPEVLVLQEKLSNEENINTEIKDNLRDSQEKNNLLNEEVRLLSDKLSASEEKVKQILILESNLTQEKSKIAELAEEKQINLAKIAELETTISKDRKSFDEKLNLLEDSKDKMSAEFKNLAHKIFEDNSKKFKDENKDS